MAAIFDPNIFYRGAALQQANQQNMFDQLGGAIQSYQMLQAQKRAQAEAMKQEAMKPENILMQVMAGQQISPEQAARLKAFDAMRGTEQVVGPLGDIAPKYRSVFDMLNGGQQPVQQGAMPEGDYFSRVAQIESGGDPYAKNPNSSAAGLFQFTNATGRQYGITNPFDVNQQQQAMQRFTQDNAAALQKTLGREPTQGELYLAHQQGAGGASKLLSNPNARAVDIVGRDAVLNNGGTPDMTAGEFAQKWIGKFGGQKTAGQSLIEQSGVSQTPRGRMATLETGLQMEKGRAEEEYKFAQEKLKSEGGKKIVSGIIDRMEQLNDRLMKYGALVDQNQDVQQRAKAALMGTGVGQSISTVTSPEIQALRNEFKSLQSNLLPFYASAAGLGAKSLDSNAERESLLKSFGDPSGVYMANKEQFKNLRQQFKLGEKNGMQEKGQAPSQEITNDPLGLFK